MRLLLPALFLSLSMLAPSAPAQAASAAADRPQPGSASEVVAIHEAQKRCADNPRLCKPFAHLVSFPAHALSWSTFGSFALHTRGVDWTGEPGLMSFTIHRPRDYVAGRPVRLRLVYDIPGDADGQDIGFSITPTSFNHGSGFETYGGESTGMIPAGAGNIHEQSVTLTFPGSYSLGGDWWYFEINRQGDFPGMLRMMSVSLEY